MKKTLVVVAHPNLEQSVVNRRWIEELNKYPQQITVHDLYHHYPDGKINVVKEQALVEQHDNLVLQFPLYWFNCTPLLKKWFDDVFTYGWAYGANGNKLRGKKMALAVSAGITEQEYSPQGTYAMTLPQILSSFAITAKYVDADYQPPFLLYGANPTPGGSYDQRPETINQSAKQYVDYLLSL